MTMKPTMSVPNLRSIDLNLLTVFEAVYEERNQVKAAERLAMTQPGVSLALSRLRYLVNDRLFQARARGLVPTPKADELYVRIHQALNLIRDEFSLRGGFDLETSQRTFVVAITYGGGAMFGPTLNALIQSQAPNVRLILRTIDPVSELPGLLKDQRIDVAIHQQRFDDPQLEHLPYDEHELVVIAHQDHPRIRFSPDLELLLAEQYVTAYDLLAGSSEGELGALLEGVRVRTEMEVPTALLLPHVVRQSELLAVMPREMAENFSELYDIRYFALPVTAPPIKTFLIWHRELTDDPGHSWLRQQLLDLRESWKARPSHRTSPA
jgi:DNA-binding transcriptional LysR family regulator